MQIFAHMDLQNAKRGPLEIKCPFKIQVGSTWYCYFFFFFPEEYDSDDLEIKLDLKKISLVVPKVLWYLWDK